MSSEIGQETFKALLILAAGWIGRTIWKSIFPFIIIARKFIKIVDRVDVLEIKVSVIDARQFALIKSDPNPVFITDSKGALIYANMSWVSMTGFSDVEHALGKGWAQAIPEEDIEMLEKLSERYEGHPSSFEGVVRFKNLKTGDIIKTMCRSEPMKDNNGTPIGTIGRLLILNKT